MTLGGFVAILSLILLAPHLKDFGAWLGVALAFLSVVLYLNEM